MEKRYLNSINTLVSLLIFISVFLHAQRPVRAKKQRTNVEKFVLAPFADAVSPDSIRIVTYIEIPFYALQFIKKGDSFIATYQASIGISDKRGKDFEHVVWSDSIITDTVSYTHLTLPTNREV